MHFWLKKLIEKLGFFKYFDSFHFWDRPWVILSKFKLHPMSSLKVIAEDYWELGLDNRESHWILRRDIWERAANLLPSAGIFPSSAWQKRQVARRDVAGIAARWRCVLWLLLYLWDTTLNLVVIIAGLSLLSFLYNSVLWSIRKKTNQSILGFTPFKSTEN